MIYRLIAIDPDTNAVLFNRPILGWKPIDSMGWWPLVANDDGEPWDCRGWMKCSYLIAQG